MLLPAVTAQVHKKHHTPPRPCRAAGFDSTKNQQRAIQASERCICCIVQRCQHDHCNWTSQMPCGVLTMYHAAVAASEPRDSTKGSLGTLCRTFLTRSPPCPSACSQRPVRAAQHLCYSGFKQAMMQLQALPHATTKAATYTLTLTYKSFL
jgi:hypothetical protein